MKGRRFSNAQKIYALKSVGSGDRAEVCWQFGVTEAMFCL